MIVLSRPHVDLFPSFLEFVGEMNANDDAMWEGYLPKPGESPQDTVGRFLRADFAAEPGLVNDTIYWPTFDGKVIGRISLRHRLNKNLEEYGGNIGYEVRPSFRRRGAATEMLKLVLLTDKAKDIGRLLLTCAPSNIASNKTILANGGMLEKTTYVEKWKRDTNYYWITL